jgi:hypothetical protein
MLTPCMLRVCLPTCAECLLDLFSPAPWCENPIALSEYHRLKPHPRVAVAVTAAMIYFTAEDTRDGYGCRNGLRVLFAFLPAIFNCVQ